MQSLPIAPFDVPELKAYLKSIGVQIGLDSATVPELYESARTLYRNKKEDNLSLAIEKEAHLDTRNELNEMYGKYMDAVEAKEALEEELRVFQLEGNRQKSAGTIVSGWDDEDMLDDTQDPNVGAADDTEEGDPGQLPGHKW